MKISVNGSEVLTRYGLEDGMRMLKESGFDAIDLDLMFFPSFLNDGKNWRELPEEALPEILRPCKEIAEKNGLVFGQAHGGLSWFMEKTPERQALNIQTLKKQILMCGYLNCPRLIIHPAHLPYDEQISAEETRAFNLEMFSALIPTLEQYHVIACIENCAAGYKGRFVDAVCGAADLIDYIDELNARAGETCFGYCLDTGHAVLAGVNIDVLIGKIGHRLEALHLNDNDGMDDLHVPPYAGRLNWERVCSALKNVGYQNTLNFELVINHIPKEVYPEFLRYIAATGRVFVKAITEN